MPNVRKDHSRGYGGVKVSAELLSTKNISTSRKEAEFLHLGAYMHKEITELLKRSEEVAAKDAATGKLQPSLPVALPHVKAIVIGCADMRVDPAHIFALEPGEAVVMRNIGGRVTPELLAQLGMLGRIGEVAGEVPGGGEEFSIIVLQHIDCGMTRLADDSEMLAQYFQVEERELEAKTVLDPRVAVAGDVAILRTAPGLPPNWLLSGHVYDVATGLVEVVVPPQPIAS